MVGREARHYYYYVGEWMVLQDVLLHRRLVLKVSIVVILPILLPIVILILILILQDM